MYRASFVVLMRFWSSLPSMEKCKIQLESMVDKGTMEKCNDFIETRRELRNLKTLDWHLSKFKRLCHDYIGGCSNLRHAVHGENGYTDTCTATTITTTKTVEQRNLGNLITNSGDNNNTSTSTNTIDGNWVRNLSKKPLTEAQEHLLAHGPNFVLVPREPPTCEYTAAMEKACQHLMQVKAEELRER